MGVWVCFTTVEQNQSRPECKHEYALPWKPRLTWKSIFVFARTGWGHFSNFDILKVVRQINKLLSSHENLVLRASSGFGFMSKSRFLAIFWYFLGPNWKFLIKWFLNLTLQTKWITPSERAWNTVPKNALGSCVQFCWKDVRMEQQSN